MPRRNVGVLHGRGGGVENEHGITYTRCGESRGVRPRPSIYTKHAASFLHSKNIVTTPTHLVFPDLVVRIAHNRDQ